MGTWNPDQLCSPDKSCPAASSALPSGAEYTAVAWRSARAAQRAGFARPIRDEWFSSSRLRTRGACWATCWHGWPTGLKRCTLLALVCDVSNPGGLPALRSLPGARVTRARTVRMAASPAHRKAAVPMPRVPVARLGQSELGTPATPRSTWRAFRPASRGPETAPRGEAEHPRRPLIAPAVL